MALPWYPKYIGEYSRDTGTLNLMQHGAYNLLLDHYYSTGPLPAFEQCSSNASSNGDLMPNHSGLYILCRAMTKTEQDAVDFVLRKFFFILEGFYRHKRADKVIEEQQQKHLRRVEAGRKGGKQAMLKQCYSKAPQNQSQNQNQKKNLDSDSINEISEEDFLRENFKIETVLDDEAIAAAKRCAPQWDIHHLMRMFDDGIRSKKLTIPDKPNLAFPAWCKKITGGKPPK